ncbi:uncharacterized protein LOC120320591 [Drosophila yakuba]|uniref:uncharacterized protein LOC120320591 n=1 Tax=Drosophila yakuba TaxID=7245 RepID=UPI00193087AB|nr:uncharacterized protein LOC120320591 [Drosophila yakuba]
MSKFDQLVRVQTDRIESLKRLFSNVKKDSSARKTEIYFEKRLNQIDEFNKEFHQAHHTLICMADYEESVYKQQNTISQFEDLGMEVYCFVAEEKKRIYPGTVTHNESANSTITTHVEEVRIPLPKLPVPKFSGNCADWPSFHDAFLRLIHNNERLDKIQRFHFLKEALPVGLDNDIRQIALTEANYEVAWTTLLQRYNNPRIVFASHMNMLYNLPNLSKEKSADIRSMVSTVNVCIAACNTVKAPLQGGDFWLTHYLTTKLPKDTHTAWEHHLGSKIDVPSYKDLQQFLNDRLVTLDAIESRNACSGMKQSNETSDGTKRVRVHSAHTRSGASASACYHCGNLHILRRCPQFLSMDCYQRKEVASKAKLCLNCLGKSHTQASCPSNKNCLHCGQRHHTMLHFPATQPTLIPSSTSCQSSAASSDAKPTLQCMSTTTSSMTHRKVLLATARVVLSNTQTGCQATVNALLDQGSEATIISEHAVQSLQLSRSTTRTSITGVGQDSGRRCKFIVSCSVQTATNPNFSLKVDDAYVLNTLTSHMPSQSFPAGNWSHIHGLMLADPYYYRSKRIDIIFGADLMAQLLLPGTKIGLPNEPIAQNTQLGWVLLGNVGNTHITRHIRCNHAIINSEELLKVFCEVESVPERPKLSKEDQWCESFFKQTHQRQPDGSYQVRLPFKRNFDPSMTLGKSHQIALNRYLQLERRLQRDPDKWIRYCKGIEEYFQLGQITLAETSENSTITTDSYGRHVASCVLPHHAVFKEESLTTKQRIVFDASARTSNGRSLNDVLCVGPTLQNDLPAVLLNWRQYQFVFTADIQRMYRCINVHPDDTQYQRILWRAADGVIKQHCLTTVTFGTASAPYTAIRVIHQIAEDTQTKYPMASNVLKNEIYVDDILSGDHSQEAAIRKSLQTMLALKSSGMELRKWASNDQDLMATIPLEHRCKQTSLSWDNADTIKTLGMYWLPKQDCFTYKLLANTPAGITKREILSTIARLFDPLGLIAPVVISAKIILKEITLAKQYREDGSSTSLDWDEPVPNIIAVKWQQFRQQLMKVKTIKIPRSVKFTPLFSSEIQLHTFCDGSSSAYAAAVYARTQQSDGTFYTTLIVAKSKISPTKPLTIPRTELCGAVLATKLTKWVLENNRWTNAHISTFYWTDATIVLHWIKGDITRWKTFVANRVSYILDHTSAAQWHHIDTSENPADCATRGLPPSQIPDIWWHGPSWLCKPHNIWPNTQSQLLNPEERDLEAKSIKIRAFTTLSDTKDSIIDRFSSYTKLLRVTAYMLRFCHNAHARAQRSHGSLSPDELDEALCCIARLAQSDTFHTSIFSQFWWHLGGKRESNEASS